MQLLLDTALRGGDIEYRMLNYEGGVMSGFFRFPIGWGCDQFGGAGLEIYPPLRSTLRADRTSNLFIPNWLHPAFPKRLTSLA